MEATREVPDLCIPQTMTAVIVQPFRAYALLCPT